MDVHERDARRLPALDTLGAIRLALTGAATPELALAVIAELVARGPSCDPLATEPVRRLVEAIAAVDPAGEGRPS